MNVKYKPSVIYTGISLTFEVFLSISVAIATEIGQIENDMTIQLELNI